MFCDRGEGGDEAIAAESGVGHGVTEETLTEVGGNSAIGFCMSTTTISTTRCFGTRRGGMTNGPTCSAGFLFGEVASMNGIGCGLRWR